MRCISFIIRIRINIVEQLKLCINNMNIGRIIIVIIVVVVLLGILQVLLRNKEESKKSAFIGGAFAGLGCIIHLLWGIFTTLLSIFILYMIYTWIFG